MVVKFDQIRKDPVTGEKVVGFPGVWRYSKIKEAQRVTAVPLPEEYIIPCVADIFHRDQGGQGSCFPGNTEVLMEDFTYKPISKITVGDRVVSHLGNIKRVTETMKRKWQGNLIKFKIYGLNKQIECTLEHPIYTARGWVEAKDLTEDDFVAIPKLDGLVSDKTRWSFEKDSDFLWVLGLYLAEGSLDLQRVCFSLGSTEMEYAERIKNTMKRYGGNVAINISKSRPTCITVRLQGEKWVDIFRELGNEYCDGKELNSRLMFLSPELQKNIFDGWNAGDGHYKEKIDTHQVVTTSPKLLRQMHHILMRCGVRGNTQNRTKYEERKDAYCLEIPPKKIINSSTTRFGYFSDGFYYSQIRSKMKEVYHGEHVYNLDVDDDHSYIVNTVAVHNCVGEAMSEVMDSVYMKITGDKPTAEEKAKAQYNIQKPIGPYKTTIDVGYPQTFSDACSYFKSRELGHVTVPSGSFIDYAILAAIKVGICRQWQWWLSQSGTAEWPFPFPDVDPETSEKAMDTAAKHTIEGYAQCTSPESIKRALFDHGWAVLSAWEVFENYNDGRYNGHWPIPRGASVGGHAMAIVGWNKAGEFIVLQSWRSAGWPQLNYIPPGYWASGFIGAIVPLDSSEVEFGREVLYQKVTVNCSDEANLTVNGKFVSKGTKFSVDLEIGTKATISAGATGWNETISVALNVTKDETNVEIVFLNKPDTPPTPPSPPTPPLPPKPGSPGWVDALNARLKAIFDTLKKRFKW
jgi:hypothetical protein